jgi:outer membrane protein assembly factor BamB
MKCLPYLLAWIWLALASAAGCSHATPSAAKRVQAFYQIYNLRWTKPVVHRGFNRKVLASFGRAAVSLKNNLVIVGTGEGEILALHLSDGELVWKKPIHLPFETTATLVDSEDAVILGARDGALLKVNCKTGDTLWTVSLAGEMRAQPAVTNDILYVTTSANRLFAIDNKTGNTLWSVGRSMPAGLTVVGQASPIVNDDYVIAAFSDGTVAAFGKEKGETVWSKAMSFKDSEFIDADANPIVQGGRLFAASYSDGIYALDPKTGNLLWHRHIEAVTSLLAVDGKLFAASTNGYVVALKQDSGELLFKVKLDVSPMSPMVLVGNDIVMAAGELGLVVLDSRNGKPLQATPLVGRAESAPGFSVSGQDLVLLSSAGSLYAFSRN